ncbi:MAG: hypothetical protein LBH25_07785 [Fibromonadaceae bacterium]|jgi:hypothetical protein|nr:hypothetical protein [Fibromonadaceae bacterium]
MKRENVFLRVLLALSSLSPCLYANGIYGQKSLRALPGIELFVHCAGDAEIVKMEAEVREALKSKLESMGVPHISFNSSDGVGALKLLLTGFKKNEGDYFIYAAMQLHQRAYLAASHEYMDCQTWDIWRLGIFSKNEIISETEQMAREFANDFISATSF